MSLPVESETARIPARNIEERARLVEALRTERDLLKEARREAEEANLAKTRFLTCMSHDLRTPLRAIAGYVDLLQLGIHGPVTDAQRTALERVRLNQEVLLTLVSDVLHFAKLDAGELELALKPVSLRPMLEETEIIIGPQAEQKGIAFTFEGCDPELQVCADGERVRQIVLNLVTNAIKYTPANGWITLACSEVDGWGEIRVRDNGPGIAPEMQEKIFDTGVVARATYAMP